MVISFLEIMYKKDNIKRSKELRILSCEQICGKHIRLNFIKKDFRSIFKTLKQKYPNKYRINVNRSFRVIGSNSNDITITSNGKSPWILVKASKDKRRYVEFLLLGNLLWGIEIGKAMQLKRYVQEVGKEEVSQYLKETIKTIISEPERWESIEVFVKIL